jgi:hypothetical protein
VLIRHRLADKDRAGGKKLIDVPGYRFQALAWIPMAEDRITKG